MKIEPSDFNTYLSPFTWRYGSEPMRQIWSEEYKRRMWRKMWVALARAESQFGLVSPKQVSDLENHMQSVDIKRAMEIEKDIHHDLMAELKAFAEQCSIGGAIIHMGATSMDIEDNAEVLRLKQGLDIILEKLMQLLSLFSGRITAWADLPVIGFTHLQPAACTSLGYRFSIYGQDLLMDWLQLKETRLNLKGKALKEP